MKKLFLIFLGIIFLFICTETSFFILSKILYYNRDIQKTDADINIVCMGDSFTYGAGVAKDKSYPAILEKKINETSDQKISVINYGRLAQNTAFVRDRLPYVIRKYHPKIVIVMAGYNNFANFKGAPFKDEKDPLSGLSKLIYRSRTFRFLTLMIKNIKKTLYRKFNNKKVDNKRSENSINDKRLPDTLFHDKKKMIISLKDIFEDDKRLFQLIDQKKYIKLKERFNGKSLSKLSLKEKLAYLLFCTDTGDLYTAYKLLDQKDIRKNRFFDLFQVLIDDSSGKKNIDQECIIRLMKEYPDILEVYYIVFEHLLDMGDKKSAIRLLDRINKRSKDDFEKNYSMITKRFLIQGLDKKQLFEQLEKFSRESRLYELAIDIFIEQGDLIDLKNTILSYKKAFPEYYLPYFYELKYLEHDQEEYKIKLKRLLDLNQFKLSIFEEVDFDKDTMRFAEDYYKEMIENIPDTTKFRESYIEFLIKNDLKEEAINTCESFYKETKNTIYLIREKAYLQSLGYREKAADIMYRIYQVSKVNDDFMAEMYILKWDIDSAKVYAQRAYEKERTEKSINRLIEVYVLSKKYKEAAEKYRELYDITGENEKDYMIKAAEYYKAAGDFEKAQKIYKEIGMYDDAELISRYNFSKDSRISINDWIRSDVEKIIEIAKENNVKIIFMNYFEARFSVIEETCKKHSVDFIDQNSYFNKLLKDGAKREDYILKDDHLNSRGNERTAELVKELLVKKQYLK